MGLDIKKLREMQKSIKKKAGQGDGLFLYSNKITEEGIDIRILPPKPSMNGVYFLEETGWWINGKFVVVDEDNDVIEDEIEEARASKDKTLIALLDKKRNNMPIVKKETRYFIPILLLNTKYDDDDELISCTVDEAKILVAKPTVLTEINAIVTARQFQNGTKYGVADRVKGYNITLIKEGSGLNTKYRAIGWNEQTEMDEKYYEDKEIPDVFKIHQKSLKSEEYQISVIRNYLYGEDIIEDEETQEEEEQDERPARRKTSGGQKRPSTKKVEEEEYEEEEEDAPAPPKRKTTKTTSKTKRTGRSLLDDAVNDMYDMD